MKKCKKCGSRDIQLFMGSDDIGDMFWWHCYSCEYDEEEG